MLRAIVLALRVFMLRAIALALRAPDHCEKICSILLHSTRREKRDSERFPTWGKSLTVPFFDMLTDEKPGAVLQIELAP
jgi:hypothetical protein